MPVHLVPSGRKPKPCFPKRCEGCGVWLRSNSAEANHECEAAASASEDEPAPAAAEQLVAPTQEDEPALDMPSPGREEDAAAAAAPAPALEPPPAPAPAPALASAPAAAPPCPATLASLVLDARLDRRKYFEHDFDWWAAKEIVNEKKSRAKTKQFLKDIQPFRPGGGELSFRSWKDLRQKLVKIAEALGVGFKRVPIQYWDGVRPSRALDRVRA